MLQTIIASCNRLQSVTGEAAAAYGRISGKAVELVNATLEADQRIQHLTGYNPIEIMRANRRNHATFMQTVFRLNSYPILVKTLPWVYRSYHARGFEFDYFPVELAAWEQALSQCLEPVYAPAILAVYRWMQEHHHQIVRLAIADKGGHFQCDTETGELQQQFLGLLLKGDCRGCLNLAQSTILSAADVKRFYLEVICPSLWQIGSLWESNELSVAEEHLATAIVGRVMAAMYPHVACIDPNRGKVLVTAAPNEHHEVGARMVADFFEMEGWNVDFLGASIPAHELVAAVKRAKPLFVAISVTTVFNLERVREVIAALKGDAETHSVKILVGGGAFSGIDQLWKVVGADGYAADAASALAVANSWFTEKAD